MNVIQAALSQNRRILTEHESKQLLAEYGIPVTREIIVNTESELKQASNEIGYPIVMKASSSEISHKTEKNLVKVDIRSESEAVAAFNDLKEAMGPENAILVQEMIKGNRELMVGMTRDSQFGPCVMFGLGGIFTEVFKDVSFRMAPLSAGDASEMMTEIKGSRILDNIRGLQSVDRMVLSAMLQAVGKIGMENENIKEIDINPLIVSGNKPIAVDALVVLE